jgi:RNA polymerase sigma factor (sigma-70 family)
VDISENIKSDYIREIHKSEYDVLPNKELRRLIGLAQDGCEESKQKVIHANLRLVYLILKRDIKVPSKIFMDCVSVGNLALMDAVGKYKVDSPAHFATYACTAIKRRIWKEVRVSGANIVLPQQRMAQRIKDENEIYGKEGALDILLSGDYIPANGVVSIDSKYDNGNELCPLKDVAIIHDTPLDNAVRSESYKRVRGALSCLTEREKKIVTERWLVHSDCKKTFEALSREILLTRERVRQIEKNALNKLRKELEKDEV